MAVLVFVSEITLAVILTLLGFAIRAILLTRWTRRKQKEIDVSRYSSEQSASLLDYEDGRDFSSQRSKRERGFRHSYSTESDTSYDDRGVFHVKIIYRPAVIVLPLAEMLHEFFKKNIGRMRILLISNYTDFPPLCISVQFTAPIPGATGPIKLSQKTIGKSPASNYNAFWNNSTSSLKSSIRTNLLWFPLFYRLPMRLFEEAALTSEENTELALREGSDNLGKSIRQEEPAHVAVPIITPIPIVIGPVAAVDSSGKITLSPMVIFPGYVDGELAKKSDSKDQILKSRGTTKFQSSQENKGALKKEILFTDSDKSLTSMHKRESKRKAKDIELEKGEIGMEVKVKDSDATIMKRQESQVKVSDMRMTKELEAQEEKSEAEIPQGQEAQVEKSEAGIPKGQRSKVKKSETGISKGQETQEKRESFEDKEEQDNKKRDAGKNKDTEENNVENKKDDGG
uniref:Testis-expressed basic protein 1 n=1 Tax=Camelus bactrianus TaxID=9837 RepID=A0A9W3G1B2_CAMBA